MKYTKKKCFTKGNTYLKEKAKKARSVFLLFICSKYKQCSTCLIDM